MSTREDVPLSLKARAYSCLAKGWLDRACKKGPTISVDHLYDAGTSANEAVALGLISEVALIVAESIQSSGFRLREGSKHPEESTERFEQLIDLWEALDARDAERAEAKLKKEEKVMRDPLGYFCAAEDCGIVATKKSTLWRCGGGCPRVLKPSYCSKDCQVAVRFLFIPRVINGAYLPYRIGSIIDCSADRALPYRVSVLLTVQTKPPLTGGRGTRGTQAVRLRGSDQARSGPSSRTSLEEPFCRSLPMRCRRRR